jgi:hypothetical protein
MVYEVPFRATNKAMSPKAASPTERVTDAYCPHCFLLVEEDVRPGWPAAPTRCPHCRLLIGSGRSRQTAAAAPGARGAAAGVFAHEARRGEAGEDTSAEDVREAIRSVAAELGARPERLLMVDYQQQTTIDPELPGLPEVFAAFGSWKRARREAATQ